MARTPPHNPDLHVVNPDGESKSNGKSSRRKEIAEAAFITVVITLLVSGGASMLWNFSKKRAEKLMRKRAQAEEERELLPGQYAYAYAAPQGSPVGRTIPTSLSMDPRLQPVDVAAGSAPVVISLAQDPTFTHFARALDKRLGALERDVQGLYDEDGPGDDDEDEEDEDDDEDEKPAAKANTRRKKTA